MFSWNWWLWDTFVESSELLFNLVVSIFVLADIHGLLDIHARVLVVVVVWLNKETCNVTKKFLSWYIFRDWKVNHTHGNPCNQIFIDDRLVIRNIIIKSDR